MRLPTRHILSFHCRAARTPTPSGYGRRNPLTSLFDLPPQFVPPILADRQHSCSRDRRRAQRRALVLGAKDATGSSRLYYAQTAS